MLNCYVKFIDFDANLVTNPRLAKHSHSANQANLPSTGSHRPPLARAQAARLSWQVTWLGLSYVRDQAPGAPATDPSIPVDIWRGLL